MGTHYISVWTVIYDFTPVRDDSDQLIVKKGQMLLLLDPFNDDWWRFRIKADRHNNTDSSGFVPRGYTQEAQFVSLAIACSDYVARADGDLTISEKESLLVYAIEEDWVLVTSLKQRATGYVLRARIRIEEAKKAVALYDYNAANPDELSFEQGEILIIINNNGEGWWHCANESRQIGLVPCNYIKSQTGSEGTESGGTLLRGTHDAVNEIQRSIDLVNQNSPSEVIEVLVTCGLKDLTFSIDLSTFSEFPDGYGDYDVYRGRLFDGTWVAVKVKVTSQQYFETSEDLTDVAREVYVWSKCSHVNVLSLRGIALFRDQIAIISPWIEENNLLRYLERTPGVNRYKLCAEICKGLSYLHTVGIIHGDLRSSNIYVSRDGTPLIADLGNSWLVDPYMEVKRDSLIGLPGRWASPELIKASSGPQKSSDVYALGMTIYEVMTGEEPYNEFSKARALFEVAAKREPPRRPESIPHGCETGDSLWALLLRCWSYEPGTRPSAIEVEESMIAIHSTLIQSRKMAAREIVSHLVARGCPEISSQLMLSSFSDYPTISEGGFSDIYQGQLLDGTVVALKVLRVSTDTIAQPKHLKHAAMELYTWNKCNHPNIMPLLGLTVFRSRIGMVSVWMKHGNLPKYLKKELGANRLNMCTQIREGVAYLHQINVVHCDLKGANVLVSDRGIPVLTDFGASSVFNQTLRFTPTTSGLTYTLRWPAAEIIKETHPHTKASDVYALGMIIYEAISGKIPYDGKKDYNVMFLVTQEKELPERPERMPNGEEVKDELWELLTRCWSYEREARPNAHEVKEAIDEIAGFDGSSTSSRQKRRLGRFNTWLTRRAH